MKLGYCLWGMPKVTLEEALPKLAAVGYQGVEMCVQPKFSTSLESMTPARRKEVRALLDQHGVALTAVAVHVDLMRGGAAAIERNMQRLRESMDLAAELACPGQPGIVVSHSGGRPEDWEAQRHTLAACLRALADYAQARDVIYATEMHTGTIVDLPEKVLWLLKELNHPALRMNFDISHTETMGIPIEVSVPALAPYSVHTHVKDQRGLWPNHEFLTPGEGPFDYVHYLRAMHAAGYTGYVMVEVSEMRQRKPDYDPFVHAAFAYRVLDYAFQAAGLVRER